MYKHMGIFSLILAIYGFHEGYSNYGLFEDFFFSSMGVGLLLATLISYKYSTKSDAAEVDVKSKGSLDDSLLKKWRREEDLELLNYLPKTAIKPTEE